MSPPSALRGRDALVPLNGRALGRVCVLTPGPLAGRTLVPDHVPLRGRVPLGGRGATRLRGVRLSDAGRSCWLMTTRSPECPPIPNSSISVTQTMCILCTNGSVSLSRHERCHTGPRWHNVRYYCYCYRHRLLLLLLLLRLLLPLLLMLRTHQPIWAHTPTD